MNYSKSAFNISKTIAASMLCCLFASGVAFAQSVTNMFEGVADDMDNEHRDPLVTVTTQVGDKSVKLLVDAEERNGEYKKYPMQFDFYINRHFLTSQFRSAELPGSVGVEITPEIATTPFNFVVIARLLHPNRTFTTVFTGAAFGSNLSRSLDCTLSFPDINGTAGKDVTFVANKVTTTQSGNNSLAVHFEKVKSTDDKETASLDAAITLDGTKATAKLDITRDDKNSSVDASGDAVVDNKTITSFKVMSEDGGTVLSCQ